MPGEGDVVETVVRQWQEVFPDLDLSPMQVIGRLRRCSALLQLGVDTPVHRRGLGRAEYDVLGALRRTGRPLTPGQLARETFASGAAVTKRLRALEERGLVVRSVDQRDRRVARLSLTDAGRTLVDEVTPDQLDFERALLAPLGQQQQDELATLLARLLVVLEGGLGR